MTIAESLGVLLRILGSTKDPKSLVWSKIGGPLTGTIVQSALLGTPVYMLTKRFTNDPQKARLAALASALVPLSLNLPFFMGAMKTRKLSQADPAPMSFLEALNYSPHEFMRDVQTKRWPSLNTHLELLARTSVPNVMRGEIIRTIAQFR